MKDKVLELDGAVVFGECMASSADEPGVGMGNVRLPCSAAWTESLRVPPCAVTASPTPSYGPYICPLVRVHVYSFVQFVCMCVRGCICGHVHVGRVYVHVCACICGRVCVWRVGSYHLHVYSGTRLLSIALIPPWDTQFRKHQCILCLVSCSEL